MASIPLKPRANANAGDAPRSTFVSAPDGLRLHAQEYGTRSLRLVRPLPPMWNEFDALARILILVIHGANSDVLSSATVDAMKRAIQIWK